MNDDKRIDTYVHVGVNYGFEGYVDHKVDERSNAGLPEFPSAVQAWPEYSK